MTVTSFNEAQQEQLKEIGAYLRQIREEKSVRIEQITAQTLIRQAFLEALEEGRYEDLPEPIFVQGFIRRYGDALGLDGVALAKNFAINFFLLDSGNDGKKAQKSSSIHIPLAVPYVVLLTLASFILFFRLNPKTPADSVAQNQKSQASPQTTLSTTVAASPTLSPFTTPATATPSPAASLAASPTLSPFTTPTTTTPLPETSPSTPPASPVEVTLELQGESWIRVKADGKTMFEGTLNKGDRKTWTANKQLTVRSGNAGAVLVSANNSEQKPLGGLGKAKTVTFTPEIVNNQESRVNSPESIVNSQ
ncbi:helix-turn-helix domain-containing protein [Westiellopsis prolifica IICB1]|nr:helix-turn-helix domain-containing protein [Westiellopsis prolifica IICB1]